MRSALYYPHSTVGSERLVKTALLLWDKLEYIVPWLHFSPRYTSYNVERAMEVIGAQHYPDEEEKRQAHVKLWELIGSHLPPQFYFDQRHDGHDNYYETYSEKLLPESWQLLQKYRLAGNLVRHRHHPLSNPAGLMVMSILADCCAGSTRSRVTDRGDAYATVAGLLGNDPNAPKIPKADVHEQLVPISLKMLDTSRVTIDALINLREREAKESGHTLRDLRHRYADSLEAYSKRLVTEKTTKADAQEIQRQFTDDMSSDLSELRAELGYAKKDVLLSKEFFATVLTATGTAASWLFGVPLALEGVITAGGAPAAIGGLLGLRNKYLKERQALMKKHPMAYLYEARRLEIGG
jgi:hypothetical protein